MTREEMWKEFENQLISETRTPITMSFDNAEKLTKLGIKETVAKWKRRLEQTRWFSATERLPETDNENDINNYDVLLWVKNKTHPEREPQIYIGKLRHVDGDDGSGNFWGIETEPCEWTIWGWSYFNEPEVIAWMPLPQPYNGESENKCKNCKYYRNPDYTKCHECEAESEDKE